MRKRHMTRIAACSFAMALVLFAFSACGEVKTEEARIYANGNNTITLNTDNSFDAKLAHGVSKAGTFSETTDSDGVTIITFIVGGKNADGTIKDGVLTIPQEWEDSHGHSNSFTLQK